jgi:peptidyl-prolyl cis-trans isomerase SurA
MTMRFMVAIRLGAAALSMATIGASAQTVRDDRVIPTVGLNLPKTLGNNTINIRKATAIVNGDVITGTDVDHRLALVVLANGGKVTPEERERLRAQVLSNLIDETLQIQEAKSNEVGVSKEEVDQSYARVSQNFKRTPQQMSDFLRQTGSSDRSLKKQIEAEIAWSRLLRRRVEPFVNIGDDEVKSVVKRLEASKGTTKFHVAEIFLEATPENAQEVLANGQRILARLREGGSFAAYARQFSQASSAGVGGDLGWLRSGQLPTELDAILPTMQVGQVAGPIQISGGFSILYLVDTQQVLVADPRDAVLSLRQLAITFPAGMTPQQAQERANGFVGAVKTMQGCGGAAAVAKQFNGDVVDNDRVTLRDLPPEVQTLLTPLQVGQSTPPFGTQADGVRVIIICGRDNPKSADTPSEEVIETQMRDEKINRRAQVYLRDLRRDAIVDYR